MLGSALHAARLGDLQGVCVPTLRAAGFWRGGLLYVLTMSVIPGRYPYPGEESAASKASAEQVGLSEPAARGRESRLLHAHTCATCCASRLKQHTFVAVPATCVANCVEVYATCYIAACTCDVQLLMWPPIAGAESHPLQGGVPWRHPGGKHPCGRQWQGGHGLACQHAFNAFTHPASCGVRRALQHCPAY